MNEAREAMAELNDEKWLRIFRVPSDISHHLMTEIPSSKVNRYSHLITFEAIRTFHMKLKLLRNQMENFNLRYFSSCNLLQNDASVFSFQTSVL
jgi:hypothetical protein